MGEEGGGEELVGEGELVLYELEEVREGGLVFEEGDELFSG